MAEGFKRNAQRALLAFRVRDCIVEEGLDVYTAALRSHKLLLLDVFEGKQE